MEATADYNFITYNQTNHCSVIEIIRADENQTVCELCSGSTWSGTNCCGNQGEADTWCEPDSFGSCVNGVWYDNHCQDTIRNCGEEKLNCGGPCPECGAELITLKGTTRYLRPGQKDTLRWNITEMREGTEVQFTPVPTATHGRIAEDSNTQFISNSVVLKAVYDLQGIFKWIIDLFSGSDDLSSGQSTTTMLADLGTTTTIHDTQYSTTTIK
jgi:hypothetical protein